MKNTLIIIDPQNDFIDEPEKQPALGVNGAYKDTLRLCDFINNNLMSLEQIYVTLDTHALLDIAHPTWWINKEGNSPQPFTVISPKDVQEGVWMAKNESEQSYSQYYVNTLEKQGNFPLLIWPPHCIKGTYGHQVQSNLMEVLNEWEKITNKKIVYIYKGENPKTEHFSALKAEVVLDDFEDTKLNEKLINELNQYDYIYSSGQASSHCVKTTMIDLIDNFSKEDKSKIVILTDTMSPVTGFKEEERKFFNYMENNGAKLLDSSFKINNKVKLSQK